VSEIAASLAPLFIIMYPIDLGDAVDR
jgi:hypothetical protein